METWCSSFEGLMLDSLRRMKRSKKKRRQKTRANQQQQREVRGHCVSAILCTVFGAGCPAECVCVCITAWMNVTECINTKENVKFVLTRLLAYFFYFTLNWSRYGFPRLRSTLSTSSRFRLVRCCLFSILYFFLHFFIFWFAFGLCQSRIGLAIGVATKYVCWRSATMKTPQQSVLWRNGCDAWSKIEVARTSRVSIRYAVLRWNQSELGRWVYRHFWLRFAFLFIFRLGVCVCADQIMPS